MSTQFEDEDYELCLMRHGVAEDRRAGLADAKRALTPEGKEGVRKIAEGLAKTGFAPVYVVSSPYVRAAETARIVADSFGSKIPFDFCDALEPGGSPEGLLNFLASRPQHTHVLAVGHEPDLSLLAGRSCAAAESGAQKPAASRQVPAAAAMVCRRVRMPALPFNASCFMPRDGVRGRAGATDRRRGRTAARSHRGRRQRE